jgi:molecular chaperone GrpE
MERKEQQSTPAGSQTRQDRVEISTSQKGVDEAAAEVAIGQENGAESEEQAAATDVSPEELQAQLAEQRGQTEMYLDHLQRLQAEFDNYRRRMSQERLQATSRGKENVLLALLPILANFQLALQHAEQDPHAVRQGVQMIWQQFEGFLAEQGVERIKTIGQPFDPSKHEALSTTPATEETPANSVVQEIKAGYIVDGRMLCPAQVVVAQATAVSESAATEPPSDSPPTDA